MIRSKNAIQARTNDVLATGAALLTVALVGGCLTQQGSSDSSSSSSGATGSGGASSASVAGTGGSTSSSSSSGSSATTGSGGGGPVHSSCMPADVIFSAAQTTTLRKDNYLANMAFGDFNHDNKADIAVRERGPNAGAEVFLGNGDGTFGKGSFTAYNVGNGQGLAVGDFDGDGIPDVLTNAFAPGESVDDTIALLLGRSDGSTADPMYTPSGSTNFFRMKAGDLNGDHKLDFVFDGQDAGGYQLNSGAGKFGGPNTSLKLQTGWTLGDLNGDGADDLITTKDDGGVCVLVNNGSAQFAAPVCYSAPTANGGLVNVVRVGDVDGDGKLDVIGFYDGSGGIADADNINIFHGNGDGTLGKRTSALLKESMEAIAVADMNNDGKADLVAFVHASDASATVDILFSNGDGTFAAMPAVYPAGRESGGDNPLVIADFAGNGLNGFAVQNQPANGYDVVVASCKK